MMRDQPPVPALLQYVYVIKCRYACVLNGISGELDVFLDYGSIVVSIFIEQLQWRIQRGA
jgi:hypothetical protein